MVKKWKKYSTGLELVLCSCERELLCVLTDDEELVFSFVWALQDRASELLAPTLKQMFDLSGHSFSELRRIGCVRGPGSFTGIRLVLATAAAFRAQDMDCHPRKKGSGPSGRVRLLRPSHTRDLP